MTRARQDRLLGLLVRDGDWVTAAALADALGVTPRSVRSYVTAINARVSPAIAVESGPRGYRATTDAAAALRAGPADEGTPRDRLHTLVRRLLDDADGIDDRADEGVVLLGDAVRAQRLGEGSVRTGGSCGGRALDFVHPFQDRTSRDPPALHPTRPTPRHPPVVTH